VLLGCRCGVVVEVVYDDGALLGGYTDVEFEER
jgi:hypothetical protein